MVTDKTLPEHIAFKNAKNYRVIRALGAGACGETVLVYDADIDHQFVVKKYSPYFLQDENPIGFNELLARFKYEARLLFSLNHPNVVRVYNFYDYPNHKTAFIMMEFVDGSDIIKFCSDNPFLTERIFEQIVDGFTHLEDKAILHRDIRPFNILVSQSGVPKIIDFGFGKEIGVNRSNAEKSITLNWWCEVPPEFDDDVYDHQTEIYFVGKIFEKIITDNDLGSFKYRGIVSGMTEKSRERRYQSFSEVKSKIASGQFDDLMFSDEVIDCYRRFADSFFNILSSIDHSTTIERGVDQILANLESIYRDSMLEEEVHNSSSILSAMISGAYVYFSSRRIETKALRDFIGILRSLPSDKKMIVIGNLAARIEAVRRSAPSSTLDDDIPF